MRTHTFSPIIIIIIMTTSFLVTIADGQRDDDVVA